MTMEEIASLLPAGFHDAELRNLSIDYENATARLEFKLWTPTAATETYANGVLHLHGLQFLVVEPGHPTYAAGQHVYSYVDGFIPNTTRREAAKLPPLMEGMFEYSLFLGDWNSDIHIAATNATFEPTSLLQAKVTAE